MSTGSGGACEHGAMSSKVGDSANIEKHLLLMLICQQSAD